MNKQQLLDMGINAFGLELFVESYNRAVKKLLEQSPDFPKDKIALDFEVETRERGDRNGVVRIRIEPIN